MLRIVYCPGIQRFGYIHEVLTDGWAELIFPHDNRRRKKKPRPAARLDWQVIRLTTSWPGVSALEQSFPELPVSAAEASRPRPRPPSRRRGAQPLPPPHPAEALAL